MAAQLHQALQFELTAFGDSVEGGLPKVLADLSAGRLREDPFPAEATARLREYARGVTSKHRVELEPGEEHQEQPVDVLLLGSVLRALGDPDWEVMKLYAKGVPIGLGVDMPRTPAVYPQS